MKYLLIEHSDGLDKPVVTVCLTSQRRDMLTIRAIYGDHAVESVSLEVDTIPEIETLRKEGIVHFEGDPSIEWLDAKEVIER